MKLFKATLFIMIFMFLIFSAIHIQIIRNKDDKPIPNVYEQTWFEERYYELVEIERPKEIKELLHYFPMLQLLDAKINWTAQINWYELKDKKTGEKIEAFKGEKGWRFRKKVNDKYWFSDTPDGIYWSYTDFESQKKEYLNRTEK